MGIRELLGIPEVETALVRLAERMVRIHAKLDFILERINRMSAEVDKLRQEVAENNTVISSAVALINGLAEKLKEAANADDTKAAVLELANQLDANTAILAAAVEA